MRTFQVLAAVVAVALVSWASSALAQEKVLVAGDPPLTQDRLVRLGQFLEWSLDLALTGSQQEECSQLLLKRWKEADRASRENLLRLADHWEEILPRIAERDKAHAHLQAQVLAELRKQNDPLSRLLLRAQESARQVLVPGNPKAPASDYSRRFEPLTQGGLDAYVQLAESVLDFRLTEQQRQEYQQQLLVEWQKAQKETYANYWQGRVKKDLAWWSEVRCRGGAERGLGMASFRVEWLVTLRRSANARGASASASDRLLLSFFTAACEPGGSRNPILLAGDPPLTQVFLERRLLFAEWILELPLTRPQWEHYQQLLIKDWKQWPRAKKEKLLRGTEEWGNLLDYCKPYGKSGNIEDQEEWWLYFPTFTPWQRNRYRLSLQRRVLASWGQEEAAPSERWLAALHQAAYRPGGERNPILVAGNPALTQVVINRYTDHVEGLLNSLSMVGGFTTPQRQVLKDYLIEDWKKMDRATREEFFETIEQWGKASQMKAAKQRFDLEAAQKSRLLVQLESTRDHKRSQWLLNAYKEGNEIYKMKLQAIKDRHEVLMTIIRNMAPSGHMEYNPLTRRYDRWVPDR